jgi:hypothetical protein
LAAPARPYRHITGRPLALPLFDAPLDPRLLAAAEAAYEISRIISLARLAPLSGTLRRPSAPATSRCPRRCSTPTIQATTSASSSA